MKYKVYIKIDSENKIIDINSNDFINEDLSKWIEIDEGVGDKFHHAQSNYLDLPLFDINHCANYKFIDNSIVQRTEEEKQVEISNRPMPAPTQLDRIEAQTTYTAMMTDTLLGE